MAIYENGNPDTGSQGPKGDKGDPGAKGNPGAKGDPGAKGADSTVVVAKPAGNPADLAALIVVLKSTGLLT